jgi:cell division transport system permease protein
MDLSTMYARAKRGIREDAKLYVVAISTLTVAFLCLATALLGVTNLAELADRWGRTHRMSVYLKDSAADADVGRLRTVLGALPAVAKVEYVSSMAAREQFLRDASATSDLASLPAEAFPSSIEVEFLADASDARIQEVADKVAAFGAAVDEVDTYRSWFERLGSLLAAGKTAAGLLAALVLVCVFAVVSNTIRLAVASRRDEIEMLKMCGATDGFVRGPFVVEGTLQGFAAALLSMLILTLGYLLLRGQIDATLGPIAGLHLTFLHPLVVLGIIVAGGLTGALGSAVSIRRYMSV